MEIWGFAALYFDRMTVIGGGKAAGGRRLLSDMKMVNVNSFITRLGICYFCKNVFIDVTTCNKYINLSK